MMGDLAANFFRKPASEFEMGFCSRLLVHNCHHGWLPSRTTAASARDIALAVKPLWPLWVPVEFRVCLEDLCHETRTVKIGKSLSRGRSESDPRNDLCGEQL
jgi:hypothetical protein